MFSKRRVSVKPKQKRKYIFVVPLVLVSIFIVVIASSQLGYISLFSQERVVETFESMTQEDLDSYFGTPWDSTATLDLTGKISGANSVHVTNTITKNYIYKHSQWDVKIMLAKVARCNIVLLDEGYPNGDVLYMVFETGSPASTNFPGQSIVVSKGSPSTNLVLWEHYEINTVYHIIVDFSYGANKCDVTVTDGITSKTTEVAIGDIYWLSGYQIGENTADFYIDDISALEGEPPETQAHIMEQKYNSIPDTVGIDEGAYLAYSTDNYGSAGTLWGHIVNADTGGEIPDTYWEDTVGCFNVHCWDDSHFNSYPYENLRIEVGHFGSYNIKNVDDTFDFHISYINVDVGLDTVNLMYHPEQVDPGEQFNVGFHIRNNGEPISCFMYFYDRDSNRMLGAGRALEMLGTDRSMGLSLTFTGEEAILQDKTALHWSARYGHMIGLNEVIDDQIDFTIYIGDMPDQPEQPESGMPAIPKIVSENIPFALIAVALILVVLVFAFALRKK